MGGLAGRGSMGRKLESCLDGGVISLPIPMAVLEHWQGHRLRGYTHSTYVPVVLTMCLARPGVQRSPARSQGAWRKHHRAPGPDLQFLGETGSRADLRFTPPPTSAATDLTPPLGTHLSLPSGSCSLSCSHPLPQPGSQPL